MISFTPRHAGRGKVVCLLAFLIAAASFTESGRAELQYVYQTRYTQHAPNALRFRHVTLRLGDGSLGVFGGFGRVDLELFDPSSEQFTTPPVTRWFADFSGVTLPDGRALLVDGVHDSLFDFATRQFVDPQNTYTGGYVRWPVLLPLPDGRIFIGGGCDVDFQPVDTCGLFDPRTLQFTTVGRLQAPRFCPGAILLDDHRVLISGGQDPNRAPLDTLELFDIRTGQSATVRTPLHQPRHGHCCIKLPDDRVLFLGGFDGRNAYLLATEILDPNTAMMVPGPNLALGRSDAHAVALPSGRIAILGGRADVRAVELYCPQENIFVPANSLLLDARSSGFTTTALDSGAVLVIGGLVGGSSELIAGAEMVREATEEVNAPAPADERTERWCVELWDGDVRQSTVWLTGYECPEFRNVAFPHPHFTAVLRATEEVSYTRLVVRFLKYAPYETRVRLFNLVGWTRVPEVVLGADLDAETLQDAPTGEGRNR